MTLSLRPFICDVKRLLPQLFRWRVHRAGSGPTIRRSPLALLDKLSGMAPSAILGAVPPQLQANAVASRALAVPMLEENQGAQILANIRGVLVADAAEWAKVTVPGVGASDVRTGTILRTALLENKVEVYTFKGKMMNCGGVGQCNFCTVRVVDGMDSLSERTPGEEKFLKKKPADYRLACQAFVNGDATVEALPGQ